VTPRQRSLMLDALTRPGDGRHVGQLDWLWHGELDTARFDRAWQEVAAVETALRTAFDRSGEPALLLHPHAEIEVVRHRVSPAAWEALRAEDHARGFDLARPPLLRVALVDQASGAHAAPPVTRMLLTYHQALLDQWSVLLLLHEFYRGYLADGAPRGGERRPDMRDYVAWVGAQDTRPAQEFWSQAVPPGPARVRPAVLGPATGQHGTGRVEARIAVSMADRLRSWAADRAATESLALQAVWALLLYRVAGNGAGAQPVGFGVSVSGRGIALDSVERLPGLLVNSLPMVVRIDPEGHLPGLLSDLRDQALGMVGYEWVSVEQIRSWCGREPGEELTDSLIVFQHLPQIPRDLEEALAAEGIRVDGPLGGTWDAGIPVTLLSFRDSDDTLVLTVVHDRERVSDRDARRLVTLCARLLSELPESVDGVTTVGDVLASLADQELPRIAEAAR
jgi:hypothetical protein